MLTILESIKLSTEYLEKKGIESPRTNAELLLADILNCGRMDLYLSFDKPLQEKEKNLYREYIARRGKFEPMQYIVGSVEFYGYEFKVNKNVLIPRQETEILIEKILENIDKDAHVKILDIGTGSGNIPITLAKELPNAIVKSIDISVDAIKTAKENCVIHEVADRVEFFEMSAFAPSVIDSFKGFDIIVSNPPYISIEEYNGLQKEIIDFEPAGAVTDHKDGYSFYKHISSIAYSILNEKGKVFFEVGQGQADRVSSFLKEDLFSKVTSFKDYLEIDRVIYGEK